MASANFSIMDRTLRRMHFADLIDRELNVRAAKSFRASLVVNPRTGLPIATDAK